MTFVIMFNKINISKAFVVVALDLHPGTCIKHMGHSRKPPFVIPATCADEKVWGNQFVITDVCHQNDACHKCCLEYLTVYIPNRHLPAYLKLLWDDLWSQWSESHSCKKHSELSWKLRNMVGVKHWCLLANFFGNGY